MKNLNLTELQKRKYEEIKFSSFLVLKMNGKKLVESGRTLERLLEKAANEKREFAGTPLADHSTSFPFEAQQALAEEFLTICKEKIGYTGEDYTYLETTVTRFFQKNAPQRERAELLLKLSEEKGLAKFQQWKADWLTEKLKNKNELGKTEFLRAKYTDLKEQYSTSRSPKHLFDIDNKEELLRAWAECFRDWKEGTKPLAGTPDFSESKEFGNPESYIPLNWVSLLSERFFIVFCLEHLDTLLTNTPKPEKQEFSPKIFEVVKHALEKKELITSSGKYTGNYTELKALYDALLARGYINGIKSREQKFSTWFQEKFDFHITDRTLRNPANKEQEEPKAHFKALIPENK